MPTRRATLRAMMLGPPALGLGVLPAVGQDGAGTVPGADWATAAPEAAGYRSAALEAIRPMLTALPTTSLMVVASGRVIFSHGDIAQVSYLASARKSILSMLYGRYVENGTIDLDRSLGDIGIDDVRGLLPIERTAKVRDLLTARSGVYHPAGSPGGDESGVPARGSHPPGSYFLYNNWDFNAAGSVFEKLTGKTVFQALATDLAAPLGLQDFDPSRQRMLGFPEQSRHLAYHLFLSGRDMARIGLVMLHKGRWNGRQVVPSAWVAESTRLHVPAAELHGPYRNGPLGYAYLWWVPETRKAPEWAGSFMANGNYGQFILVLPALDTVIVHRRAVTDEFAVGRNMGTDKSSPAGVTSGQFLPIADAIVAAR
jgi:CubicO group peptidase (beta-lactamase class C family)